MDGLYVRHDVLAVMTEDAGESPACGSYAGYGVVDPGTGAIVPLEVPPCLGVSAVGDGWFARPFGSAPVPVGVFNYDGTPLWKLDRDNHRSECSLEDCTRCSRPTATTP